MAITIDAFTPTGRLTATVDVPGRLRDALETAVALEVVPAGLSGRLALGPAPAEATVSIAIDDLLLVVPDTPDVPVHATWHDVSIEIGPYLVTGELPTMPGFDPGRSIARPSGTFVQVRVAGVAPLDGSGPALTFPALLVNRYAVEAIEADLMLGFFFPGARLLSPPPAVGPAGQPDRPPAAAPGVAPGADGGGSPA